MMRVPSARGASGQIGGFWDELKHMSTCVATYGADCGAASADAETHGYAEKVEPSGQPADVVAQQFVDQKVIDAVALCQTQTCASEVEKYVREAYAPMVSAWYLAVKNGQENEWGQAEYDIAAAQIAAVFDDAFTKKVNDGIKQIVVSTNGVPWKNGGVFTPTISFADFVSSWQTGNGSAATYSFDHSGGGGIPATFDAGTGTTAKPAAESSSILPTVLGVVALAAAGWAGYRVYKGKPVLPKF